MNLTKRIKYFLYIYLFKINVKSNIFFIDYKIYGNFKII